jgi:phosphoglycolate phosphatase
MYKGIIFDLDGTLLNTSLDIHAVLNDSLNHFGLPQISLEKTVEYVGNGAKILVERAIPKDKNYLLEDVYKYYAAHFAACNNDLTCLYDGEEEVLLKLKEKGVKFAIVTNKPQNATEGVYRKHLSHFNFDYVLGQTDKFPLKPSPNSTLFVIDKIGLKACDCLFVGDGETDIETAKNAGVDCLSVLWGYRGEDKLRAAGGRNFVGNYQQLLSFIENNVNN